MKKHPEIMIFTIGHSTRPIEEFINLLKSFAIELVADIRTIPRSRHNPQFNAEALTKSLQDAGLAYIHLPGLGGLRHPKKDSPNKAWKNNSFRGFADYMLTEEFRINLRLLIEKAEQKTSVIMCAEAVPWHCHRSLVGDALVVRGIKVVDLMSEGTRRDHVITPWAKIEGDTITYPVERPEK